MVSQASQSGRSWPAILLALTLGIAIGYGASLVHFELVDAPDIVKAEAGKAANEIPDMPEDPGFPERGAVVTVSLHDAAGGDMDTVSGVILDPGKSTSERWLLVPAKALYGVRSASVTLDQLRWSADTVIAIEPSAGIAALDVGNPRGAAVPLSKGSLYLGLAVLAVEPGTRTTGWVDSAARQHADGSYYYAVRLGRPLSTTFGALLSPETGELIGVITAPQSADAEYEAQDAIALERLVTNPDPDYPMPLSELGARFFAGTEEGRLISLELAADGEDWPRVLNLGRQLLGRSPGVGANMDRAYLALAGAAKEDGRPSAGLVLLEEAAALLGPGAARATLHAQLLSEAGRPTRAIEVLKAAVDEGAHGEGVSALLQTLILEQVRGAGVQSDAALQLLEAGIQRVPGFAPFHAEYGLLLHRGGRYGEALVSFREALALDGSLRNVLQPLMDTAQQRLDTPAQTVAPLHSSGSGLYVNANINGRPSRMLLDTGATYTAISHATARAVGARGLASAPVVELSTANGVVEARLTTLSTIDINGALVRNVQVVVLDSFGDLDGLLGLSYLRHFDIDLDQAGNQIVLMRR